MNLNFLNAVDLRGTKLSTADDKEEHKDKLNKIIKIMETIEAINLEDKAIDTIGDTYEYLINSYASEAGQSGGEFYTPPEVSQLMAKLIKVTNPFPLRVYDPACGTGSLLLALKDKTGASTKFIGQEINKTSSWLCKANLLLNAKHHEDFQVICADTLVDDRLKFNFFDAVISNPPYSLRWPGKDNPELLEDPRYSGPGVLAPRDRADFAFILTALYHLNDRGTAAILCYPGVLYRLKEEEQIRK